MEISVIIPVYNTENELDRCLHSLLDQTYKNFEVILVDDGSTDNSLNICKNYSIQYENFKVITKSNGGAASARNIGLDNAQGKYIAFIDSDDVVDKDYLLKLYTSITSNNVDMAVCGTCSKIEELGKDNNIEKKILCERLL